MSVTKVVHFSFPFLVHYCIPIDTFFDFIEKWLFSKDIFCLRCCYTMFGFKLVSYISKPDKSFDDHLMIAFPLSPYV